MTPSHSAVNAPGATNGVGAWPSGTYNMKCGRTVVSARPPVAGLNVTAKPSSNSGLGSSDKDQTLGQAADKKHRSWINRRLISEANPQPKPRLSRMRSTDLLLFSV